MDDDDEMRDFDRKSAWILVAAFLSMAASIAIIAF